MFGVAKMVFKIDGAAAGTAEIKNQYLTILDYVLHSITRIYSSQYFYLSLYLNVRCMQYML